MSANDRLFKTTKTPEGGENLYCPMLLQDNPAVVMYDKHGSILEAWGTEWKKVPRAFALVASQSSLTELLSTRRSNARFRRDSKLMGAEANSHRTCSPQSTMSADSNTKWKKIKCSSRTSD